jgi:hypothetical protein
MKRISLGMADAFVFSPQEERPCGDCRACCTVLGVEELRKPNYTPCRHECSQGCAIYQDRPSSCRVFNCWWKIGMVDGKRPDKSGIIVDSLSTCVRIWEAKPGALRCPMNRRTIGKLKNKYGSLVVEGTKDTWGKIWAETAPAAMQQQQRALQDHEAGLMKKLMNLIKSKED